MHKLTLFYSPMCGYCRKVTRYMEENNISLQAKDVSAGSDIRRELQSIGGKTQVPCLVIDGQALYESDDIIQWLKDHWGG